ncbi:hypothetical protein D5086_000944 [Populus alba]|uniref:Uncharacterized protein n=1 Tax=Populus alba TaxID=43335 RepID=A0ACC4CYP0_POPAL
MGSAYEYMFLLPDEHAELLKFKPQVPVDGAAGMCSEILAPSTPPPFKPGVDFVHHYKKPEDHCYSDRRGSDFLFFGIAGCTDGDVKRLGEVFRSSMQNSSTAMS